MVRAVLRAAGLLAPEVFEERTPGEYACDPAAMVRLADVVGALARVHLAAARHGVAVVSPSPPSAACGRQYSDGRSSPDVVSLGPPV
jgi:hypothetical protein